MNILIKKTSIIVYTIIAILGIYATYKGVDVSMLTDENSVFYECNEFSPDFGFRKIDIEETGLQQYTLIFKASELEYIESQTLAIIISNFSDNAYRVYLNGIVLGQEGNMINGHSMLKNSSAAVVFDRKLLEETNELIIETYATYKTGITSEGVYITDDITGMILLHRHELFGERVIVFSIGVLVATAILMIFIFCISEKRNIILMYCALASLCFSFFFVDFLKIVYLPRDYFFFKKVFMVALYWGIGFYTLAIERLLKSKTLRVLTLLVVGSFTIVSFLAPNIIAYKSIYSYWFLALLVLILYWVILGIRNNINNLRNTIILFGFIYIASYCIITIVVNFMGGVSRLNSPVINIITIATLPLIMALIEISNKENKIVEVQAGMKNEFINSITDVLTSAWNQRYLYMKLNENPSNVTLAMLDLDDFKMINDSISHLAGDYVLKAVSQEIRKVIRESDDFCRYGGDEFVVIFYDCHGIEVYELMERLRKSIEEHEFVYQGKRIHVTISIGIYSAIEGESLEVALKKVDDELYLSKENGKNFVSLYEGA